MLDLRLIREQPEMVERALAIKGGAELVKQVVALDASRRELIRKADDLKADRKAASLLVPAAHAEAEALEPLTLVASELATELRRFAAWLAWTPSGWAGAATSSSPSGASSAKLPGLTCE